jgi:aryl-alcohol dehydrogenase-like predicted oxidoreductase
MELRSLGSSNLQVTPIGLGLAALGRPGYINLDHAADLKHEYEVEKMAAHAGHVLDAAYEGGIRYFDAARSYGKAEQFLGGWLKSRGIKPAQVAVGSKWGYTYTADWQVDADIHEVKEHSPEVLLRQWGESQSNLEEYLVLYQIHSATFESGVLENKAVHNELARLKTEGVLVGFSVSGSQQAEIIKAALDIFGAGSRLFDSVQVTWNILEQSATSVLEEANRQGVGVIVKEAVANGRLTAKNPQVNPGGKLEMLKNEAERLSTTIDALALAYVLNQPWADVVLSGAARVEHLLSNLGALDLTLDDETRRRLAGLVETPQEYWEARSALAWN